MSLPRLHAEVSAIVSASSSLPRTTPSRWFLIPLVMQHGTPSSAQNNMAAVSADGSTVWVLIRRLNSSCRRSIAFVVLALRHWVGGRRVKVKRRSAALETRHLPNRAIPERARPVQFSRRAAQEVELMPQSPGSAFSRRRDLKQPHSTRTERRAIAIIQQSCSDLLGIANSKKEVSESTGNNCDDSPPVGVLR
jgi:hypothetical protein